MRQVTNIHLHYLLGILDYYVLCMDRGPSQFRRIVTNCVKDPPRWFCDSLWKVDSNL